MTVWLRRGRKKGANKNVRKYRERKREGTIDGAGKKGICGEV